VRKVNNRIQIAKMKNMMKNPQNLEITLENSKLLTQPIFSKAWKSFSFEDSQDKKPLIKTLQSPFFKKGEENLLFQRFYNKTLFSSKAEQNNFASLKSNTFQISKKESFSQSEIAENNTSKHLSKKDKFLERYKTFLYAPVNNDQIFLSKNQKEIKNIQNESQYRPITLLHPLKFYFQKDQALKRKFQFYGVKLFRNFNVENNAPYFRVMMKKFFYYYKPSLRWERTLRVATMRKARRKSSRIPRKFNVKKTSQILANTKNPSSLENLSFNEFEVVQPLADKEKHVFNTNNDPEIHLPYNDQSSITKPTHFYSLVEKRASRYRYQIYKDVLQHWYYSPLNRFLLKLDVDSFIRRQPNSYFLTINDEKFLHLKRQLLSEYYETLRWYTSMQHYSTMKSQIGGTKSLSSRAYNQQFMGTFKKIRHLFNITPSFHDQNVLKFDQPLYNEYKNNQKNSIFDDSILHEELLADDYSLFLNKNINKEPSFSNIDRVPTLAPEEQKMDFYIPEDLTNQSAKILREYLSIAAPIRQNYISKLLNEKNYWELTKFLFLGQKMRGTNPITNETDFLNQEKNYLLNSKIGIDDLDIQKFKEEMWIPLLLKCQKKLYDQESLKNYVTLKKEKYENQKQKHEKYLKNRLERMQKSFVFMEANQNSKNFSFDTLSGYTSSIQKAMKESILWQKNSFSDFKTVENFMRKKIFLQKTNIRNNRPSLYSFSSNEQNSQVFSLDNQILNTQKMNHVFFKNNLKNSVKNKAIEILSAEKVFSTNFDLKKDQQKSVFSKFKPFHSFQYFFWNILRFKNFSFSNSSENNRFSEKKENNLFLNKFKKFFSVFPFSSKIFSLTRYGIQETRNKNLDYWKKRENALSKRRKIRKTLKRLRTQNPAAQKIIFENRDFYNQTGTINIENKSLLKFENKKPSRQKPDFNQTKKMNKKHSWKKYYFDGPVNAFYSPFESLKNGKKLFEKKFIRKRSRLRRYSSFKGRGPIKKRTLREKLKRQFKSLKKYGASQEKTNKSQIQIERENKKIELIQLITGKNSNLARTGSLFMKRDQKQRRTRQIKHRAWKKKKQNFSQKRRKLRKRRRSTLSKIRVFNKKLQRILSKKEIQTWWWQTFFPNFQSITEKNWQFHKNMQIRKQFFELSEKDILERDQAQNSQILQIGDKDYKPLAIPQALRIRDQLVQKQLLRFEPLQTSNNLEIMPSTENKNIENSNLKKINSLSKFNTLTNSDLTNLADLSLNSNPSNDINLPSSAQAMPPDFPAEARAAMTTQAQLLSKEQGRSKILDDQNTTSILDKFTENVSGSIQTNLLNSSQNNKFFVGTNPIPFYAGWDESLRKFVITNRLLSRKECFSYSQKSQNLFFGTSSNKNNFHTKNIKDAEKTMNEIQNQMQQNFVEFTKAPLQGMNAATTLYWQIPFTTYDPDQFFALGMDGFSPLGWRNFSFKHSKQTTKPILVKNFFSWNGEKIRHETNENYFSKNLFFKFLENTQKTKFFASPLDNTNINNLQLNEFENFNHINFSTSSKDNFPLSTVKNTKMALQSRIEIDKNFTYRRILKKQKRIKKHPRPPVWFPSGSLAQQVLPVHYIYVFYKRSRLPRDRYIRRRLRSTFLNETFAKNQNRIKMTDFTLRKRVKPRRKYHRKRFLLETNMLVLRRRKFRSFVDENDMNRPSSKMFQSFSKQEKRAIQSKQRRRLTDSKQTNENLRLRQLRRRVQRQVFRPIWRYKPRSGGFVWPGDYLRLELVKAPLLNSGKTFSENFIFSQSKETSTRKIRKKKRRTIQEWQIQPKKYLLEKHNLKVLKKRFEKSMQSLKL